MEYPQDATTEHGFGARTLVLFASEARGNILPSCRGIALGWDLEKKAVHLLGHYGGEPDEMHIEALRDIAAEMSGVIGFSVARGQYEVELTTEVAYSTIDGRQLNGLDAWGFRRYEGQSPPSAPPDWLRAVLPEPPLDRAHLLLAAQQSLVGRVDGSTRSISVEVGDESELLRLRAYVDAPPSELQRELLGAAAEQLAGLSGCAGHDVELLHSTEGFERLQPLAVLAYLRYETAMGYFD